jgi:hypothetical protein
MHTLKVLLAGFAFLLICLIVGRFAARSIGMATACLIFIPLWLAAAVINLYMGVDRAGYSVTEELPVFLLIFLLPTLCSVALWRKLR